MKRKKNFIIILISVIVFIALTTVYIKYNNRINTRIARDLEIKIPFSLEIDYRDSHGWFGEGTTLAKTKLTHEEIDNIIKSLDEWRSMPFAENIKMILENGKIIDLRSGYGAEEFSNIYNIENGYWMMLDRSNQRRNYTDAEELELGTVYSFSIAVIDSDTNMFYYIEEDF